MKKVSLLFVFLLTSLAGFSEEKEAIVDGLKYQYNTESLTAKVIANRNASWVNYPELTSTTVPVSVVIDGQTYNVTALKQNAFQDCSTLTSISLQEGLLILEGGCLSGTAIQTITIPSTVNYIGKYCFSWCESLSSLTIPAGVTQFMDPLKGCINLGTITVEAGNTVYDSRDNCNAVIETATNKLFAACKNTTIPNTITSIHLEAFAELPIQTIIIPENVTTIVNTVGGVSDSKSIFQGCHDLTSVSVDAGNTTYDSRNSCNAIIETANNKLVAGCDISSIPDGITALGLESFLGCNFSTIDIPSTVLSIENRAFEGCEKLETITIPENVTSIGSRAFLNFGYWGHSYQLSSIKSKIKKPFPVANDTFGAVEYGENYSESFVPYANAILKVPVGTKKAYETTEGWQKFTAIEEDETLGSVVTTTDNGDGTVTVGTDPSAPDIVEIPEQVGGKDVTAIGDNAFAGKTNVIDIYLPETDQALTLGSNALKIDDDHVATVHVPLSLLVDYALNGELKQNFEAGKVVATITAPNQYWTFSSGVDVLVPDGVKVYICKAINGSDIQIVELTDAELTVDGKKVIKANNGVLISSTSGNAYDLVAKSGAQASGTIPAAFENANSYEGNKLVPVVRSQNYDPDQYYMLYNGGFIKIADGDASKTPACRALLKK